jgi:hypothetical protein
MEVNISGAGMVGERVWRASGQSQQAGAGGAEFPEGVKLSPKASGFLVVGSLNKGGEYCAQKLSAR